VDENDPMAVERRKRKIREQVLKHLRGDASFVLATHEHMDGDAIGSLCAMHAIITELGKDSLMFIPAGELPLPPEYDFFNLDGAVPEPPADIAQRTVVLLDCGNIDRNPAEVLRDGRHLLNIDHHHDNTHFGTLNYVVPDASCTAEIIWELMRELPVFPSPGIATALYVGLVTDTGRFMYENTGPLAHHMAADMIAWGVNVQEVYHWIYEEMPYAKLVLLGVALSQVQRFDSGELTLAMLDAEDFARAEAEDSNSEGIVDHLRAVQGTKVAALVRELTAPERRGQRKVSLRAVDDDVDVSTIARAQGGGGHRRAAGFSTTLAPEELIEFLRREIAAQLRPAPASASAAPA
jgi:phosphoesterase RecJ-like protein